MLLVSSCSLSSIRRRSGWLALLLLLLVMCMIHRMMRALRAKPRSRRHVNLFLMRVSIVSKGEPEGFGDTDLSVMEKFDLHDKQ